MSENTLSEQISDFIQSRADAKLQILEKSIEKDRKSLDEYNEAAVAAFDVISKEKTKAHTDKYQVSTWLTDAATRASQINMVSHAPKYTHGDAKGSGVYFEKPNYNHHDTYLSSKMLLSFAVDTVGNAAALDVAALLSLSDNGQSLLDQLVKDEYSALSVFTNDEQQLADWATGFKASLQHKELSSHKLSKQLFFPLEQGGYHLISPLFASSFCQGVYDRISESRFSDDSKDKRKAKKDGKYLAGTLAEYRNSAVQTFGGTKPQNISLLNSRRGGRAYLLSCHPPVWRSQSRPPTSSKTAFWKMYERRVWGILKSLRKFLEKIEHRDSTVVLREIRQRYVDELVGELLQLAAEIQALPASPGWSIDSKLPLSEQLWLDSQRDDESFVAAREAQDWQEDIARSFSTWLNYHLNRSQKLAFGDVEFSEWKDSLKSALKADLRLMAS